MSCYFASRSIISYNDLELELVETLRSFSIPSMASLQMQNQNFLNGKEESCSHDPNEIDIENLENFADDSYKSIQYDENHFTCKSFSDFGLGPLYNHPVVCQYFPEITSCIATEPFISAAEILNCLATSDTDFKDASIIEIEQILCKKLGVKDLLKLGIILGGNLKLEMLMISHVNAARMKLLIEIQKKHIYDYACQERLTHQSYSSSGDRVQRNTSERNRSINGNNEVGSDQITMSADQGQKIGKVSSSEAIPKLVASSRSNVSSLVTQCELYFSDSAYSPSFSKALDAVDKFCKESISRKVEETNSSKIKSNKKRARRKKEESHSEYEEPSSLSELSTLTHFNDAASSAAFCANVPLKTLDLLKEVAAEYLMLHIGGEKYRAKRFVNSSCSSTGLLRSGISPNQKEPEQEPCKESEIELVIDLEAKKTKTLLTVDDNDDDEDSKVSIDCGQTPVIHHIASNMNEDHLDRTDENYDHLEDDTIIKTTDLSENYDHLEDDTIIKTTDLSENYGHLEDDTIIKTTDLSEGSAKSKTNPVKICGIDAAPFECKLFSHSSTHSRDELVKPVKRGQRCDQNSIFTIPNDDLRDIAPWCKGLPLGGESRAATVLDGTDLRAVGRWGESLVYQYLRQSLSSSSTVEWLNIKEESRAGYDIIIQQPMKVINGGRIVYNQSTQLSKTTFVEVKTTRFDDLNTFEISLWEWQFATANPRVNYHIYRVFNAGDLKRVRVVVIENILELITSRKVRLCLSI